MYVCEDFGECSPVIKGEEICSSIKIVKEEHLKNELSNSIVDLVPSPELSIGVKPMLRAACQAHSQQTNRKSIASETSTSENNISAFE